MFPRDVNFFFLIQKHKTKLPQGRCEFLYSFANAWWIVRRLRSPQTLKHRNFSWKIPKDWYFGVCGAGKWKNRSRDEIPLYRCYFFQGAYQVFEKLPQLKIKRSCLQRFSVLFKSSNVLHLLNMIVGTYLLTINYSEENVKTQ
jgi:hypothetical protein